MELRLLDRGRSRRRGRADETTGQSVVAFVILRGVAVHSRDQIIQDLRNGVAEVREAGDATILADNTVMVQIAASLLPGA